MEYRFTYGTAVVPVGQPYDAITRLLTRETPIGDWLGETYTCMNGAAFTRRERNRQNAQYPLNA